MGGCGFGGGPQHRVVAQPDTQILVASVLAGADHHERTFRSADRGSGLCPVGIGRSSWTNPLSSVANRVGGGLAGGAGAGSLGITSTGAAAVGAEACAPPATDSWSILARLHCEIDEEAHSRQ